MVAAMVELALLHQVERTYHSHGAMAQLLLPRQRVTAGTYTVTATDANGCTDTSYV